MKIRKNVGEVRRYAFHRFGERAQPSTAKPSDGPPNTRTDSPTAARGGSAEVAPKQTGAGADEPRPTYDDGYNAGIEEGYDKGFQEGAKAAEDQLSTALEEHFNTLLEAIKVAADAVGKESERVRDQFEAWLPRAVLLVSEAVLQREVETNVATLIPVIRSCLADLPQGEPVTVLLNPTDHELLAEQPEELWNTAGLTFVPDASVSRGGALVEGVSRVVDARLESRLLEAARQLLFPRDDGWDAGNGAPSA